MSSRLIGDPSGWVLGAVDDPKEAEAIGAEFAEPIAIIGVP